MLIEQEGKEADPNRVHQLIILIYSPIGAGLRDVSTGLSEDPSFSESSSV